MSDDRCPECGMKHHHAVMCKRDPDSQESIRADERQKIITKLEGFLKCKCFHGMVVGTRHAPTCMSWVVEEVRDDEG